jgi:hypothetical protein
MSDLTKAAPSVDLIRVAGVISIVVGIISAIGVVFLIMMFILFATSQKEMGYRFGMLNDICVALQYLLTIPVALALYPILKPYNPALVHIATITGVIAMLLVTGLQLLLIFKVLTFEQQVVWVSLAMIMGVGFWLIISGLAARSTGRLPASVLMSSLAVPYVGYPVWAIWLGLHLLNW